MNSISTYAINLEKRTERKIHLLRQFKNKKEFDVKLVKAIETENGALGLWQTIIHIIKDLVQQDVDYILICEDDHQFTEHYSKDFLFDKITIAKEKKTDILIGGVSWFGNVLQIQDNLFWVDQFTGTQFIILFKDFYQKILNADFQNGDTADRVICALTENKLLIYPFISTQKEFGYSDATTKNNTDGYVTEIFDKSVAVMDNLVKVKKFYNEQ